MQELLFRLLDTHYEEFRDVYDERFANRYSFWRSVTDEVVGKYLQCGDPHFGFARIRCEECGTEYFCRSPPVWWILPVLLEEEVIRPCNLP